MMVHRAAVVEIIGTQKPKDTAQEVRNNARYADLIRRCGLRSSLSDGRCIHAQLIEDGLERNTFLCNLLVTMYGRCQSPQDASRVFEKMQEKSVFTWTCMITAFAQNGLFEEALHLFRVMEWEGLHPNDVTLVAVISACSSLRNLTAAKSVHKLADSTGFVRDVVVATSLVNMYAKCGSLQDARKVFEGMQFRNVVTWNAMITAYARYGRCREAIELFTRINIDSGVLPNNITFSSLLAACRSIRGLQETRLVHSKIIDHGFASDVIVGSMLIDAYAKCGSLEDARRAFEDLKGANLICWTAMTGAYIQHGFGDETIQLFRRMDLEGLKADVVAFVNALGGCAVTGSLKQGRLIHARVASQGLLDINDILATALANMYSKCGSPDEGREAFNKICDKDSICWNGMISAYARHSDGADGALEIFREMQLDGTKVTGVTYLNVLHACSHKGLVEQGWEVFVMMREAAGVEASVRHFRCMVDILARAGRLEDAQELMNSMPFEAGIVAWKALLAGCRTHGENQRATAAAQTAIELQPEIAQTYVMLFNVYGDQTGNTVRQAICDNSAASSGKE